MLITVLYIEDNPLNRRLVRKLLTAKGYQVLEAIDGSTGLEMVRAEKPNLVLLDINLPDIDGLELVKQLRTTPEIADIPVIALTANAMHGDRERCLAAGCDAYLAKPIARQELYNTLNRFITEDTPTFPR
jgi:two-component system, cell cycle response regulator DivK